MKTIKRLCTRLFTLILVLSLGSCFSANPLTDRLPYDEVETSWWRSPLDGVSAANYSWDDYQGNTYSTLYLDNYAGSPVSITPGLHPGVDMPCVTGTKVYPIHNGTVHQINTDPNNQWGMYVIIHHDINGTNMYSAYCHLSEVSVSNGEVIDYQTVMEVESIGLSGNTGNSEGAHLHFQIDKQVPGTYGPWWPAGFSTANSIAQSENEQQNVIDHTWDPMMSIKNETPTDGNIHPSFNSGSRSSITMQTPIPSLAPGTYTGSQDLELSSTPAHFIRYTIDGSDPTYSHGTLYVSNTFTISEALTLKAKAYLSNGQSSDMLSASYVINEEYSNVIINGDFSALTSGNVYPDAWNKNWDNQSVNQPFRLDSYQGKVNVINLSKPSSTGGTGVKQVYSEAKPFNIGAELKFVFRVESANLAGDGWHGTESPMTILLVIEKADGSSGHFIRYYNYTDDEDSAQNPNFEKISQNTWITKVYSLDDMGLSGSDKIKSVHIYSAGWNRVSYVDLVEFKLN